MKKILLVILYILIAGCAKEEFSTKPSVENFQSSPLEFYTYQLCSSYTLIKPPVDFLFLWDNSSSQTFINSQTKAALNNTINMVATHRFDYHIAMAPLFPDNGDKLFLISENPDGLSSSIISNNLIARDQAGYALDTFPSVSSAQEQGFARVNSIIRSNISNGVFRKNAYTIVVIMSNGENQTTVNPYWEIDYSKYNVELLNLKTTRDHYLQSKMFRLISLVDHGKMNNGFLAPCQAGNRVGSSYYKMSHDLYNSPASGGVVPQDQGLKDPADSYSICGANFNHIFDGVNNSIVDVVLAHKYKYWPIAASSAPTFDPGTLEVYKIRPTGEMIEIPEGSVNGFRYIGVSTQNTRIEPSVGEPFTGHLIELSGSAQVTYPDCLKIETRSPYEYYGYIHLQNKPNPTTIKVQLDGQELQNSSVNGWTYHGYYRDLNVKVKSPSQPYIEGTPAMRKTGYFLKLHGTAIFSNNTRVQVVFEPAGE